GLRQLRTDGLALAPICSAGLGLGRNVRSQYDTEGSQLVALPRVRALQETFVVAVAASVLSRLKGMARLCCVNGPLAPRARFSQVALQTALLRHPGRLRARCRRGTRRFPSVHRGSPTAPRDARRQFANVCQ